MRINPAKLFKIKIDKKYAEELSQELNKTNQTRCLIVLYVMIALTIIIIISSIVLGYDMMFNILFLFSMLVCLASLLIFAKTNYIGWVQFFVMAVCIGWAQYANFDTNGGTDDFTPYLIGLLALSAFTFRPPGQSLAIFGLSQAAFIIVNIKLINDGVLLFIVVMNSTLFTIFSWVISVFHYKSFVNTFVNDKLLDELNDANKKLEKHIRIDAGTGISNRLAFTEYLDNEWERARRYGKSLSIAMIDIDFFKQYNDTYGHSKGDICLRYVAECINRCMYRVNDFAGRYGGEEFVVIMPETDKTTAFENADRIRSSVEALCINHDGRTDGNTHVTISIGVTTMIPDKEDNSSDFIEKADKALYAAKHQGKNRVVGC
ncbi:MAG: GGDEF domain-containing protein [Spirochaetales bacterium]|nr:GGDEF domain-containing protein [Spirochaetales bacterium]